MKLLLIEDSARLRASLASGFQKLGFAVDLAGDGKLGRTHALAGGYDVIVLDLMLPLLPGLDVLRDLRAASIATPVLILSARDRVDDRVRGLQLGADDYLVKPFSFDELHARIQVLIRRRCGQRNPCLEFGPLTVNTALHRVSLHGEAIALTPTETSILEFLALYAGRVLSLQQIYDRVYDSNTSVSMNAIEAHISGLRRRLREAGADPLIRTSRGFGYFIESPALRPDAG